MKNSSTGLLNSRFHFASDQVPNGRENNQPNTEVNLDTESILIYVGLETKLTFLVSVRFQFEKCYIFADL